MEHFARPEEIVITVKGKPAVFINTKSTKLEPIKTRAKGLILVLTGKNVCFITFSAGIGAWLEAEKAVLAACGDVEEQTYYVSKIPSTSTPPNLLDYEVALMNIGYSIAERDFGYGCKPEVAKRFIFSARHKATNSIYIGSVGAPTDELIRQAIFNILASGYTRNSSQQKIDIVKYIELNKLKANLEDWVFKVEEVQTGIDDVSDAINTLSKEYNKSHFILNVRRA